VRLFACSIVAALFVPRIAAAAPTVSVLYRADAACPGVSAFLAQAAKKSRNSALFAPTTDLAAQATVAVAPGADGFTGRLSIRRAAMAQGRAAHALELLGSYNHDFASGSMSSEAAALRVEALVRAGRQEEAREAALTFLAKCPRSPLSDRVRVAAGLCWPGKDMAR
jgi:hypothetical protein